MRIKQCLFCHKDFNAAKKTTKYCCRVCQSTHLASIYSVQNGLKRRSGKYYNCLVCSTEFYAIKARELTAKFCSRRCTSIANPENTKKARDASPLMKRAGMTEKRKYVTLYINGKQVREHRYVMEQYLKRKLLKDEHVHHINGNPQDNRIENLQVLSNSDHQKLEFSLFSSLLSLQNSMK